MYNWVVLFWPVATDLLNFIAPTPGSLFAVLSKSKSKLNAAPPKFPSWPEDPEDPEDSEDSEDSED